MNTTTNYGLNSMSLTTSQHHSVYHIHQITWQDEWGVTRNKNANSDIWTPKWWVNAQDLCQCQNLSAWLMVDHDQSLLTFWSPYSEPKNEPTMRYHVYLRCIHWRYVSSIQTISNRFNWSNISAIIPGKPSLLRSLNHITVQSDEAVLSAAPS